MPPSTHRGRRVAAPALVALLLLAALAPAPRAQGVRALMGGSSGSDSVEAESALTAAHGSFEQLVRERLGLAEAPGGERFDGAGELPEARREELAERAVSTFRREAERELAALQGDGLLHSSEVSRALGELRELRLEELREAVRAEGDGHAPPPRRADFDDDWTHTRALLRYVFTERNGWRDWAILAGSMFAGFALAVGVLKLSKLSLGEQGGSTWKRLARAAVGDLHAPLYVLFAAGGLGLGLSAVWLPSELYRPTWTVLLALMIIALFWMAWRMSAAATRRVGDWATPAGESPGEQVLEIVRKLLRLGLILLFVFLGVEIVFGTDLTALLAGLGIAGLAVTLAAQDTLKDLFAAITIHVNHPFGLGDLVRFEGHFGTIEEVGFRMTRLRTLEGHVVSIPNAKLVSELVENVSARPHIRRRFRLDLPYDTPLERVSRAVELVREVIREAGDLDEEQEVQVHFDEFGPHSLRLLVQYYYKEGDYWASKAQATEIDLALVERFRAEGIEFAFPTRTLHVVDEQEHEEDEDPDADRAADHEAPDGADPHDPDDEDDDA